MKSEEAIKLAESFVGMTSIDIAIKLIEIEKQGWVRGFNAADEVARSVFLK